MIYASIDIGSNSILLLIGTIDNISKKIDVLYEEASIAGLGKNIDKTGKFSEESLLLAYEILQKYRNKIDEFHIESANIVVTATEAARVVSNASIFKNHLKAIFNFDLKIISGKDEAFYSTKGIVSQFNFTKELIKKNIAVIMDIGGASTEFIKVQINPFKIINSISLPIGVVRLDDWINENLELDFSYNQKSVRLIDDKLNAHLNLLNDFKEYSSFGIAGTLTALKCLDLNLSVFEADKIEGTSLLLTSMERLNTKLSKLKVEEILEQNKYLEKRVYTIQSGSLLALYFGNKLNISSFIVSAKGLRYGTLGEEV